MESEEGRKAKELCFAGLAVIPPKTTIAVSGVIRADCGAFVPQGESALGRSTHRTLICASFKAMDRTINIVFAGMTAFIEVRIGDYL